MRLAPVFKYYIRIIINIRALCCTSSLTYLILITSTATLCKNVGQAFLFPLFYLYVAVISSSLHTFLATHLRMTR